MSQRFHCSRALLAEGWARDVAIEVDDDGLVTALEARAERTDSAFPLEVVLPGVVNLHSHAFQRAMSGLTERRESGEDSFWTWRETMYRFVARLDPDHLAAVAAQAYAEMLEAGFTRVCEFHYVHHAPDGTPYADPAEMSAALVEAARATGIGLTLLPVFYAFGGFGGQPAEAGQRRFVTDASGFIDLHAACARHVRELHGGVMGMAAHSLRAVTPSTLAQVCSALRDGPMHVHAAEQMAEVEGCLAWSGARPVEWLLNEVGLDERWCVVHATHLVDAERDGLAASGAVAGICPITEANLGDGIFDGVRYREAGGRLGVGSDSNTRISLAGEMALLEYSQRLRDGRRARLVDTGSTGRGVFDACVRGGAQAGGADGDGGLRVGSAADWLTLDTAHPGLVARDGDDLIDAWLFGAGADAIDEVWVGGRRVVERGRHVQREATRARFARALSALRS